MFKTIFKNKTTFDITEQNCSILIGQENENPDLNVFQNLSLAPNESFEYISKDSGDFWARFSSITYKQDRVSGGKFIDYVERKGFDDPIKGKYICVFKNNTESVYSFKSEFSGNFSCLAWLPTYINLSVLNPFTKFSQCEIRWERRLDQKRGFLRPRQMVCVGTKLRSKTELIELEKDKEMIMKKHNLQEISLDKAAGVGVL